MEEKTFVEAIFDDNYISMMTRCIAEIMLEEEKHPKFKQRLN